MKTADLGGDKNLESGSQKCSLFYANSIFSIIAVRLLTSLKALHRTGQ